MIQILTTSQQFLDDYGQQTDLIGKYSAYIDPEEGEEPKVWESRFEIIEDDQKTTHRNAVRALYELSTKLVEEIA